MFLPYLPTFPFERAALLHDCLNLPTGQAFFPKTMSHAATVAREFVFHPTQVLTDMPDGSLVVEFTASGCVEMAWHLII
jgi:hypothetical protein